MTTEEKEIYAIGEIPPLGFVPKKMHAWVIRRDRHGNPMQSFQEEEFDVPEVGPSEVLILVMAAGVNYNGGQWGWWNGSDSTFAYSGEIGRASCRERV